MVSQYKGYQKDGQQMFVGKQFHSKMPCNPFSNQNHTNEFQSLIDRVVNQRAIRKNNVTSPILVILQWFHESCSNFIDSQKSLFGRFLQILHGGYSLASNRPFARIIFWRLKWWTYLSIKLCLALNVVKVGIHFEYCFIAGLFQIVWSPCHSFAWHI